MSTILNSNSLECNYSYQHIQGSMLVSFNKLACELKLTHAEYRIMSLLIGFWNKKSGKSFPTIKMLAQTARMSNSTVSKSLNTLVKAGLIIIVKDKQFKRNNYYINTKKLLHSNNNVTHEKSQTVTPCSKIMKNKKEFKQYKKKQIILNKSKQLQYMNQFKYWKHKPSGKIYQVKPDIGKHLLYKYICESECIHIFENNITDKIGNFEVIESLNKTQLSNTYKPDKKDLLNVLIKKGQIKEARKLASMFKIKLNI